MSFPDDLLDQAKHLASRDAARPKQASLRRAISSAYYGLFHLLAEDTAFNFAPPTPNGLRETVQRVLAHTDMKNVCKVFVAGNNAFKKSQKPGIPIATQKILKFPLEVDLLFVMNAFIDLQESRHLADYDSTVSWNKLNVLTKIDLTEKAFEAWARVHGLPNAIVFKGALIFQKHWSR